MTYSQLAELLTKVVEKKRDVKILIISESCHG